MSSNGGQTTMSSFFNMTRSSTAAAATTTNSSNSIMPDDSTSFLLHRLKSISEKIPRVDSDGFPYVGAAGQTGKQSVKNRQHINSRRDLQAFFNQQPQLQHRPLYIFNDPRQRAESKQTGPFWTEPTMLQAAMEFCIPSGLRVCFVCPELWDRDLLHQDDRFKRESGGVMAPCLHCGTNQYMRQTGWTVGRSQNVQRTINKAMTHRTVVCSASDSLIGDHDLLLQ